MSENGAKTPVKKKTTRRPPSKGNYAIVNKRLIALEDKVDDTLANAAEINEKLAIVAGGIPSDAEPPEDGERFMTSKEQFSVYRKILSRHEGELSNKKFMTMMEQICTMREDFFKLCGQMEENIDSFTATDVLESFKAYQVDMENILLDAGVDIGPYDDGSGKLNTIHQRIVGVVPTDDPDKNMKVAERLAEGYEYQGRVLLKERVNVFKTTGKTPADKDKQ